jgi:hypothetical protein
MDPLKVDHLPLDLVLNPVRHRLEVENMGLRVGSLLLVVLEVVVSPPVVVEVAGRLRQRNLDLLRLQRWDSKV